MLGNPQPETTNLDAPPHQGDDSLAGREPGRSTPRSLRIILACILLIGALATGAYRELVGRFSRAQTAAAPVEKMRLLVRAGQRVFVTEGSPLRAKLAVEPVAEQDIKRSLVLPAVVEADPGRLIKVLPPLAGRVTQLKVQLGERVESDQPLVVIDSPDLAAAYAEYDRAKVLLSLALKSRDRQRNLIKIGGAAEKDVQQAETDYVT
ncbi:MAG TPA: efflux RND transporter periplasmic adaptor subunit, partial [Xanthobacteraceae bacterium]